MISLIDNRIDDILGDVIWSPTDKEVERIYPKERWKGMKEFYRAYRNRRIDLVRHLRAEEKDKEQVREQTVQPAQEIKGSV